jgi:endonuclease YncB( thermonuclease family)
VRELLGFWLRRKIGVRKAKKGKAKRKAKRKAKNRKKGLWNDDLYRGLVTSKGVEKAVYS